MKKILYILLIFMGSLFVIHGQESPDELWKKVDNLERKGLPKSALEQVRGIYKKAKRDKNSSQQLKAMLYASKYMLELEENAQLSILNWFKKEIAQSSTPQQSLLQNVLASMLWQYFRQHRWQFYKRTKTATKGDENDFRTWDLETLFAEIHQYFQLSLIPAKETQKIALSQYDAVLITQQNSKTYRPSLYDFLCHQALEFYKTSETGITKPQNNFSIDTPDYLRTHTSFSNLNIRSQDSLSLQFHALKIYQNLLKFHSQKKQLEALTEINIERITFVYANANFDQKDSVLLSTLQTEQRQIQNRPESTLYAYQLAKVYQKQGNRYQPQKRIAAQNQTKEDIKEKDQWRYKKALSVCDSAIISFPKSRGAGYCKSLKVGITTPELSIQSEKLLPTQTEARLLITYKNIDHLYARAAKVNLRQLNDFQKLFRKEDKLQFLKQLKISASWDTAILNEKDYQQHRTEIKFPALDQGHYLLIISPKKHLDSQYIYAFGMVQITNLALLADKTSKYIRYQVVDRQTGKPKAQATIRLQSPKRYGANLDKTLTTNALGFAQLEIDKSHAAVTTTVIWQNDTLHLEPQYLSHYKTPNRPVERVRNHAFLFTDRSIYRPKQTVYFKGILMQSKANTIFKPLAKATVFAKLIDTNGQQVAELRFTTNAFGSFSGKFILPKAITGTYRIQTNTNGSTSFSVEEYKRPKFNPVFLPVTQTYKLQDRILLQGSTKAYAGYAVSDAKVVYRVRRKVRYPVWCYWIDYPSSGSAQEIAHGETTTDQNGDFTIPFVALPDKQISSTNQPIFTYDITAEITSNSGETRAANTSVRVGYHTMTAVVHIPNAMHKTEKNHVLKIETQNLNGQAISATGTVQIFKLQSPEKPLRKRPWQAPDYPGFEREEFQKRFPNEAFGNESDYRTWQNGLLKAQFTFNTKNKQPEHLGVQEIPLAKLKNWQSGIYRIELQTKDRLGQIVKDVKYTRLFDPNEKGITDQQLFSVSTDKNSYLVGDEVCINLGSASQSIAITVDIEKQDQIVETKVIHLTNESKIIRIPVKKEDLGGFVVHYHWVNYNSYQAGKIPIPVPYAPTELQIETKTFRDKVEPGQSETWSFKVLGPKGEQVTAEVLASMYDASLDRFKAHQWNFNPIYRPTYHSRSRFDANSSFDRSRFSVFAPNRNNFRAPFVRFDKMNWFGFYFGTGRYYNAGIRSKSARMRKARPTQMQDQMDMEESTEVGAKIQAESTDSATIQQKKAIENQENLNAVPIRKNLNETAFFYPKLTTDANGNFSFTFTSPEALTQWKLQLLAHTKTMQSGTSTYQMVTQKKLMVQPNPPRFLRAGDCIEIRTNISNLSEKNLTGEVALQMFDPLSNLPIETELQLYKKNKAFDVPAKGNTTAAWELWIPDDISVVGYKIIAKAGKFSDGEQGVLPVLSNRLLVTETLPMWVGSDQQKTFTLSKLKNDISATRKNHQLSLELASNPAWYAIQALPYLMETSYECSEQLFSRYYANTLAAHIANSNSKIRAVFDQWKNSDALLSALEKNQEFKSVSIAETPWLRDAQSESELKKRIGLLFDQNNLKNEQQQALKKLGQLQHASGAFAWFAGGRENRYITQYLVAGFGHLQKLSTGTFDSQTQIMIRKALQYLDDAFLKNYEKLKLYCKKNGIAMQKDHLSYMQVHYLYTRSFFKSIPRPKKTAEAFQYYIGQCQKYGLQRSLYAQGLIALTLAREGQNEGALQILRSVYERSIFSEELGRYWKSNTASWNWYQAPIETQALLIAAFSEIQLLDATLHSQTIVEQLKIWLLKNKQTNRWPTTKATAHAVYALLLQGSDWLQTTETAIARVGNEIIDPKALESTRIEAGTGYFKKTWQSKAITSEKAVTTLTKKGKGIAWGALYWQYFEDLDKITTATSPLSLQAVLYLKKNTDRGEEIQKINTNTAISVGDLLRVRITLRTDRNMEFVHMKSMRAAGLEPVSVRSGYQFQDGLGYYQSTRDTATHFFFDYLPKGIYVFEYDLRANNKGTFSNGITSIQSMYAPEFGSHAAGERLQIH